MYTLIREYDKDTYQYGFYDKKVYFEEFQIAKEYALGLKNSGEGKIVRVLYIMDKDGETLWDCEKGDLVNYKTYKISKYFKNTVTAILGITILIILVLAVYYFFENIFPYLVFFVGALMFIIAIFHIIFMNRYLTIKQKLWWMMGFATIFGLLIYWQKVFGGDTTFEDDFFNENINK